MNQTNFTLDANPSTAASTAHQASGQSIFWALISLAISAMLQPSFTGYCWSSDSFEGSLWPHRSSPFVCAVDTIAEFYCWAVNRNTRRTTEDNSKPASRGAITLQLVVFFLGVVPQAIKLFSVRGILGTQLIATAFLVSSIPSLICSIRGKSPNERVAGYVTKLARQSRLGQNLINPSETVHLLLFSCGIVPHVATIYRLLDTRSDRLRRPLSENAYNLSEWIGFFAITTWAIILPTASVFGLFRTIKPATLILPTTFCVVITKAQILSPERRCEPCKKYPPFMDQLYFMLFLATLSFTIAYVLHAAASLTMAKKRNVSPPDSAEELNASSTQIQAQSIELQRQPAQNENSANHVSRTYINTGVQTIDFEGESGPSAMEAASTDITDAPPPNPTPKQPPSNSDKQGVEPWMWLGLYWLTKILPLKPVHFAAPKTFVDKSTQTGSPSGEDVEVEGEGDATPDSTADEFGLVMNTLAALIVFPVLYTAKYLGPLYLATASLGKRSKRRDAESAAHNNRLGIQQPPALSLWKTVLLIPLWFVGNWLSAFFRQYFVVGHAIETMFHLHEGEVKWIAFGIMNFLVAALYYLLQFDGTGTWSPGWIGVLG